MCLKNLQTLCISASARASAYFVLAEGIGRRDVRQSSLYAACRRSCFSLWFPSPTTLHHLQQVGLEVLERRCRFLVRWILVSFFDLSLSLCSTPAPFFLTLELCRGIMNSWCMCGILHGFQYFFYFLFCGIPVIG
jgi:hypothetical protein